MNFHVFSPAADGIMLIIQRKNYHIKYRQRSRTRKSRFQFQTNWRMVWNSCAALPSSDYHKCGGIETKPNQTKPYAKWFSLFFFVLSTTFRGQEFSQKLAHMHARLLIVGSPHHWTELKNMLHNLVLKFLLFAISFAIRVCFTLSPFCLNYWKVPCDIFKCELNKQRKKSRTI